MAAGGMNASTASPNTSGYSGPAPTFGGGPFLSPTGGGTPPSMTATPPTNPTPAPPQPQMQPAVMPPYGGPQRGPGSPFGDNMDSFGRRGGYENLPADRMPQQDMFGRERFGFREPPPDAPTWSQQGGVYSYDPNGQQQRGGFNPFGNAPAMPNAAPGRFRQMMQERLQQMRAQPPAAGLGAINPYVGEGPLPGRSTR